MGFFAQQRHLAFDLHTHVYVAEELFSSLEFYENDQ